MGKKWKRLLIQHRRQQADSAPAPDPVVSNSEVIERMEAAVVAPAPEPEIVEEPAAVEPEVVVEAPKPKRRRATRRKKTASGA
jgi:hypothetical protein